MPKKNPKPTPLIKINSPFYTHGGMQKINWCDLILSWLLVKGVGSDVCDEGLTRTADEMQYSPVSDQPELDCLEQQALPKVLVATTNFSVITLFLQFFQEPHISTWVWGWSEGFICYSISSLYIGGKRIGVLYSTVVYLQGFGSSYRYIGKRLSDTWFLCLPPSYQCMQHKAVFPSTSSLSWLQKTK